MKHDWSYGAALDVPLECHCSAGKTCPVKGVVDSTFKQRYRDQMIDLIRMVIEHACDPIVHHDCTGDTKRVTNLKNYMDDTIDLTSSWVDLTIVSIGSKERGYKRGRCRGYKECICSGARKVQQIEKSFAQQERKLEGTLHVACLICSHDLLK